MQHRAAAGSQEPETLEVTDDDGETIFVYRSLPDGLPKAAVQILHGMGEHARRYDHVARAFADAGYAAYADDHRASGRTGAEGPGLGNLGPRGMIGALDATHAVTRAVHEEQPDVPVFLLGHSWGSFLAQKYAERWGGELKGLLLSGSTLMVPEYATFGGFNDPFEPAATPYDWLSRDPVEVRRYIDDPWCGLEVAFPPEELIALFSPPADTTPPELPVLVFNGTMDAVGGSNNGGRALADAYRALGVHDVTFLSYEGGRHELFNETNRDEVIGDVIGWLDKRAP